MCFLLEELKCCDWSMIIAKFSDMYEACLKFENIRLSNYVDMLNIFNQENFDSKPDLATLRESIHPIDIFLRWFSFPL